MKFYLCRRKNLYPPTSPIYRHTANSILLSAPFAPTVTNSTCHGELIGRHCFAQMFPLLGNCLTIPTFIYLSACTVLAMLCQPWQQMVELKIAQSYISEVLSQKKGRIPSYFKWNEYWVMYHLAIFKNTLGSATDFLVVLCKFSITVTKIRYTLTFKMINN